LFVFKVFKMYLKIISITFEMDYQFIQPNVLHSKAL
jgi:hypothetical protein